MTDGEASVRKERPWLWPVGAPPKLGEQIWAHSAPAEAWGAGARGIWAAIAVGVLPLALSAAFGVPGHEFVSASAVLPIFLGCIRRDDARRGIALLLLAFLAHSLLAMGIAEADPETAARIMPGAQAYWERQRAWVRTGWDLEYEPAVWIPAHLGQLGAGILGSYVSLGWITFFEGFRQVDWMNFYSVRLADCSRSPTTALFLGWHVWSIARGLGFAVLSFEVLSLSLGRLTGRKLSRRRDRVWRWSATLALFVADALFKFFLVHPVQQRLHDNLQ